MGGGVEDERLAVYSVYFAYSRFISCRIFASFSHSYFIPFDDDIQYLSISFPRDSVRLHTTYIESALLS